MDILGNSIALLSQRDHYTAAHSSRVFYYATRVAGEMGCATDRRFNRALCFASLLHDIGKIGIKDHVLLKPGMLTDDEQRQLATHPVKGCRMLKPYKFLRDAMDLVRFHHERPDGEGYPDGLAGEAVPLGASIIAVADCFDAMTTNRPYRRSLSYETAVAEIEDNLGKQFDREAGRAFLSIVRPALVQDVRRRSRRSYKTVAQELINGIVEEKGEGGARGAH
jgi:HD-GYP domain-containing protein (c-di-GMP phosphodiesterase class II)